MKKFVFSDISFILLIMIGVLNLAFNIKATIRQEEKPLSLEEFNKQVNKKDTVVLVYFSAEWCTVCAKVKPVLLGIERDFSNKKFQLLKIDTDRDREITEEFGVDALPVFMIYKKGCREWIYVGLVENYELRNQLKYYL